MRNAILLLSIGSIAMACEYPAEPLTTDLEPIHRRSKPRQARIEVIDLGSFLPKYMNGRGQMTGRAPRDGRTGASAFWNRGVVTAIAPSGRSKSAGGLRLNIRGQVIGQTKGEPRAFVWKNGVFTDLQRPGDQQHSTHSINDRGQVTMSIRIADFWYVYLWRNGRYTALGSLGGSWSGGVNALFGPDLNNRGQVTGISEIATGERHAFFWSKRTGMLDLGTLGGPESEARAINARGQVVGLSEISPGSYVTHGFFWSKGIMHDLGLLQPVALNDKGEVVGQQLVVGTAPRASVWRNGTSTDLGSFGGPATYVTGINNRGQIVGLSRIGGPPDYFGCSTSNPSANCHAFLWEDGVMIDLGTLGGHYSYAITINKRGVIAGHATDADGVWHGVLWKVRRAR